MIYDTVILGGGPAGLTAALYAARYGLKVLIISENIGGMANLAVKIENYPGFEGSGPELMKKFYEQAKSAGAEFLKQQLIDIKKDKKGFVVKTTSNKQISTRAIIIALGTEKKKLNIKGEDKFLGKGVSYCATCDAGFFKNKTVALIGGSDSACNSALILSEAAKKVYIIYRKQELRCENAVREKVKNNKKIEIICNAILVEIKGNELVKSLVIKKNNQKQEIKLDGVFIEIGTIPGTSLAKKLGIKIDKENYIIVNENMETNVKGVFAAGDIVKSKLKQVIVAAAHGVIAARSVNDFLNEG